MPANSRHYRGFASLLNDPLECYYAGLAVIYTIAVCVASLAPWHFVRPEPATWDALWQRFPLVAAERPSITDGLSNVALFVPLGFLWSAIALYRGSFAGRLLRSVAIAGAAAVLAMLIECVQVAFPGRSVSQYDVAAETVGALLGITGWWLLGPWLSVWLALRQPADRHARWRDWALQGYLLIVALVWLAPFDLTIRPGELLDKFQDKRVVLQTLSDWTPRRIAVALGSAVLFTPVGFWLAAAFTRYPHRVRTERECRWQIVALAALLAGGQTLVYSRRTDILEIVGMLFGMCGGVALARYASGEAPWRGPVAWLAEWRRSRQEPVPSPTSRAWVTCLGLYYVAVVSAAIWILWRAHTLVPGSVGFSGWTIPRHEPTLLVQAYWTAALACLLLVPRVPVMALLVYITLGYGVIPRNHGAAYALRGLGILEVVALLSMVGLLLFRWRAEPQRRSWHWIVAIAACYALWAGASTLVLRVEGRPWNMEILKQLVRIVESAALVWIAAESVKNRLHDQVVVFVLPTVVTLCGVLFPKMMYLDHVTSMFAALSLPLVAYGAIGFAKLPIQVLFGVLGLKLLSMLHVGNSRAAIAGGMAGLIVWGLLSQYRWRLMLLGILLVVPVAGLAYHSHIGERFTAIVEQRSGWDTGRLQLWENAENAFRDFPLLGAGPGSLADAHSSYLSALGETGIVGLVLYIAFWVATLVMLGSLIWRHGERWPGATAKALFAAVIVQLVNGVGYSLQALQLAFILAGWGIALANVRNPAEPISVENSDSASSRDRR